MRLIDLLKEWFGIDGNTAATIVITLSIFILGYVVNGINNAVSVFIKRRNYRKIFSDVIETVASNIGLQSKMFHKSSENVNIMNPDDYVVKTITITHLDNVDKLDFKDIYNAHFSGIENIFNKKKLKAFNKVFGRLSLIKGIEGRLASQMSSFDERFHEHEQQWNEFIEKLRQLTDAITAATNGVNAPQAVANYLEGMDRIILRWQQMPNRKEYSVVKEHYVDRLLAHNRDHQDLRFQGNPMLGMNTLLLNAAHYYDNMEKTLQVYSESLNDYYHLYRGTKRIIDKAMKIMNSSYGND